MVSPFLSSFEGVSTAQLGCAKKRRFGVLPSNERFKDEESTGPFRSPCSMSHVCGRSSSEKKYSYKNQSKAADKKCCCVTTLTGDSKYFIHGRDKQHKIKRLRTRKERCQMRADKRETSKNKSHHHHCFSQSKKNLIFYPNNHHNCHLPTRKNAQILSTVAVTQEPSIITESRLLGHHGLFNHEVKSINIERVLSEQSKLEESEEKTNEETNDTPYLSSTPSNLILLSSDGLLGADADVPVKKKAKTSTKTHDDSQDIEMTNLQFSNPGADTSGQRLQQQLPSSCESFKSTDQSKKRFQTTKTKHTDSSMSGMDKALQPKPLDTRDKIKTVNKTINGDQDSSSETDYLVSSPRHVASLSADNFDQQNLHQDPEHVWKTTHEVAEHLSEWLHFPVPHRRDLSSETREVLLKALQERHGPHLQANLQEMQRTLRFYKDPSQASIEQEQHMMRDDKLFSTDASVKTTGSERLCWTSSPQTCNNLQQITEELANPVDTFVKPLDETFKPGFSPFLHMDFEPSGTSVSDLFAHSPISYQQDNVSGLELWETSKCKTQESDLLDLFQNNFVNQTRNLRERLSEQQPHHSNVQPFFSHQDRHSADLHVFPREQNPSKTDRFYFAPFFPSKSHRRSQSNHLQGFGQFSPVHQNFRPDPTDMMHYPPSHMLERNLVPPSSSLPSPEHWSFPPMRLY
ncbi:proline-rich protein 19 [Poecilia latipinna]|uniref:proline-rich protein 19 n=1 Tax=Poecilia latipinna TaxID=48699 RepID=UPI00072E8B85|nr:PREDICTED: uncharacterized protein LOC106959944 [Poecilia latipinna]